MNTEQLAWYMLQDPFIRRYYGGVLAIDELPIVVKKPTVFIVNTDPIALPGTHWVVLFMDTICEHFDSAGFTPRDGFDIYLTAKGPRYIYNDTRLQNINSSTCGLFCLFYCYFRCRGYSFADILNMFSSNLQLNEIIVRSFYTMTT